MRAKAIFSMGWVKTMYPYNVNTKIVFAMVMGIRSPNFLTHSLSKGPLIPQHMEYMVVTRPFINVNGRQFH